MRPDDEAGVVDAADALVDGLLRELGRGGAPGADERFVGRVLRATTARRRAWGWKHALAAGLLLTVAGVWGWQARPLCWLIDGNGVVVRAAGWRPFGGLGPGDAVEVAAGGRGSLVWSDGTRVDLGAASRMELPGHGDPFSVRLGHGSADATVAPQPAGRPFVLATSEATVTVEGTAFTVTSGTHGTAVALRHGALYVSAPAGAARLLPGDAAAVVLGQPPRLSTARDAPVRFRESHQDPGSTWRTDAVIAQARWFEVEGSWIRVLAIAASAAPGTALLPVPVLPTRWRAIVQLRLRSHPGTGQIALAFGEVRLPLTLEPEVWRRVHIIGDESGVALAGSSTRVALTRPADVIGVAVNGVEIDIGEVVVLDEGP